MTQTPEQLAAEIYDISVHDWNIRLQGLDFRYRLYTEISSRAG
jgi:hypothetical protein